MTQGYDALGFYHDPADPRLLVPKRNPALGWTVNVSHRFGPAVLLGLGTAIGGGLALGLALAILR